MLVFVRDAVSQTINAQLTPQRDTWRSHFISKHRLDHNKKSCWPFFKKR